MLIPNIHSRAPLFENTFYVNMLSRKKGVCECTQKKHTQESITCTYIQVYFCVVMYVLFIHLYLSACMCFGSLLCVIVYVSQKLFVCFFCCHVMFSYSCGSVKEPSYNRDIKSIYIYIHACTCTPLYR